MKTSFKVLLPLMLLLTLPAVVQAQDVTYTTNNGTITITGYMGSFRSVTNVAIPSVINGLPVTVIGTNAFYWCGNLSVVTIPDSVTCIQDWAFGYCRSLTNVTIPDSVTNIGTAAFYSCSGLTDVTIPNSLTSLGDGVFTSCSGLTAINVDAMNSVYSSVDGVLFNKNQTTLIQYPMGKVGGYTIPNGATTVSSEAFYPCPTLTSVTIPSSVNSIGVAAFYWCTSLAAITVDPQNSTYVSVAGALFNKSLTVLIQYPEGKAGSYTLPDSVTTIGDYAFSGSFGLTSITLGKSVTEIRDYALSGCFSLTGLYFQGKAPSINPPVLNGSTNATVYYLPWTTGWGPTFGGYFGSRPTALWRPLIETTNNYPVGQTTEFGFNVSWANDTVIVVEASTNLGKPTWVPVGTNTLTRGSSYFSDSTWTNYPSRYYRLRWP